MGLAYRRAAEICDEDVEICKAIGRHGLEIVRAFWEEKGKPSRFSVLTHCNPGWLACIDWGTALAPIYIAFEAGVPVHVWVDETRPRNQGASLTAFELGQHGVDHTVIADNLGGHLMQHGLVDMVIAVTDRTTATGDICNKIGTYLKALAAHDNDVPFYVALPFTTIDWSLRDGVKEIPIEKRNGRELSHITGRAADGALATVDILPSGEPGGQFRLRRHARPPSQRAHHRARRRRGQRGGPAETLSGKAEMTLALAGPRRRRSGDGRSPMRAPGENRTLALPRLRAVRGRSWRSFRR